MTVSGPAAPRSWTPPAPHGPDGTTSARSSVTPSGTRVDGPPVGGSAPDAPFGLPDKGKRRRRPRLLRWVVLLLILYPIVIGGLAWFSLGKVDAFPPSGRAKDTGGTTYLVIGSDSREDLSREERARLGTGQATGVRTDTIMLLHLTATGPAVLVSIPRDSYVTIPGHGKDKINAAFAYGGPRLLVQTVEQATGLRIDDFVMTGLGGFAGVVDAVGGVRICPKVAIKDAKAHIDVPKGCQTMDGPTALGYARARYSDPRGDLGRVERQREVLAAIAAKTLSPSVLGLPWRAGPAAVAGGRALTVDSGTTPWGVGRFVLGMRAVSGGDGVRMTVPIANASLQTPAGEAVQWDRAQALKLFAAMAKNDIDTIRAVARAQAT
jgi:LCP family protein required for cell wall assembly